MNLISILQDNVKKYRDKIAIIEADDGSNYTYYELYEKIEMLAGFFKSQGIEKNIHAGIYLKNSAFQIISFFALLYLGAVPVLIDAQYTEREIRECMDSSETSFLISEYNEKKASVLKNISSDYTILAHSAELKHGKRDNMTFFGLETLKEFAKNYLKPHNEYSHIILFTYRGFGYTLAVLHTEKSIINSILKNNYLTEINSLLQIIIFLPSHHIFALTCNILSPLSVGGTIVIINNLQASKILSALEMYRINFIIAVPTLVKILLHSIKKKSYNFHYLKRGIIGGDKFTKQLYDEWYKLTDSTLLQGYGLTETCPVLCNQWNNNKPDSMGLPMMNVLVKIVGKNGIELPRNEPGRLWIKTDSLMEGYYNLDEPNKTLIKDGWFDTGDTGYKDEDGFFYFTGREKMISKIGGATVDRNEVIDVLKKHPDIDNITIKAEYDDLWQEKLVCTIKSRKKFDKLDILSFCSDKLSYNKIPKDFIFIPRLS